MSTVISTENLSKVYGKRKAVDSLSLDIREGEIYGFLGANGAGKTTTMRMMLGLIKPTHGTINVMGHAPGTPASLAQIGSMIETPAFYPHLTGYENLQYLARLAGADAARIRPVLHQVGLLDRAGDPFRSYSLGMKQRLGVASALLKEPKVLILDEPTNGLDPAGMAEMRQLIRDLGASGHTVMVSSHLMSEIEQIADRVGIIASGRIVTESTIQELRGDSRLVISADPIEEAVGLVRNLPGISAIERVGDALHLTAEDTALINPASITVRLVRSGIEVRELRWERASLESIFLRLTGAPANAPTVA